MVGVIINIFVLVGVDVTDGVIIGAIFGKNKNIVLIESS